MRKHIIALVLDGKGDTEIVRTISKGGVTVTRQAIGAFKRRHADVLKPKEDALIEMVVAQLAHRWIADKDERLGRLEQIYEGLDKVREDYGFMVTTEEAGEDGERHIFDHRFNGALAAQMRGVLSDASDELGQKPKPNVNINTGVQVLVRDYHGFDPE